MKKGKSIKYPKGVSPKKQENLDSLSKYLKDGVLGTPSFPHGGTHEGITPPKPTYQDSMSLYNKSQANLQHLQSLYNTEFASQEKIDGYQPVINHTKNVINFKASENGISPSEGFTKTGEVNYPYGDLYNSDIKPTSHYKFKTIGGKKILSDFPSDVLGKNTNVEYNNPLISSDDKRFTDPNGKRHLMSLTPTKRSEHITNIYPKPKGSSTPTSSGTSASTPTPKPSTPNMTTDWAASLRAEGKDSSYAARKQMYNDSGLEKEYGAYKGSADQNIAALNNSKNPPQAPEPVTDNAEDKSKEPVTKKEYSRYVNIHNQQFGFDTKEEFFAIAKRKNMPKGWAEANIPKMEQGGKVTNNTSNKEMKKVKSIKYPDGGSLEKKRNTDSLNKYLKGGSVDNDRRESLKKYLIGGEEEEGLDLGYNPSPSFQSEQELLGGSMGNYGNRIPTKTDMDFSYLEGEPDILPENMNYKRSPEDEYEFNFNQSQTDEEIAVLNSENYYSDDGTERTNKLNRQISGDSSARLDRRENRQHKIDNGALGINEAAYSGYMAGQAPSIQNSAFNLGSNIADGNVGGSILSGAGLGFGLTRGVLGGYSSKNATNDAMTNYYDKDRKNRTGNYTYSAKDGGTVLFKDGGTFDPTTGLPEVTDLATGEYIYGLPKHLEETANAEVEAGEWVKDDKGTVMLAKGEKHTKGGLKLKLKKGTEVVSDNLRLSAKAAKECSASLNLSINNGDTYATTLDKYTKALGLDKLTEDQEVIFKKLKKQVDIGDEDTMNTNVEYLSEKIMELEELRVPLEEERSAIFDYVFDKQENYKESAEYGKMKAKEAKEASKKESKKVDLFPNKYRSIL